MNYKETEPMVYIMSGYNQRAVIAFLRYLKKIEYDKYSIIAANESDQILNTIYKDRVIYIRKEKQLTVKEFKDIFDDVHEEGIFMPSTEALVRFQIDNRDFFKEYMISIPVVEKRLYETISDKREFWNLCRNSGFWVPEIYTDIRNVCFPLMIKPKKFFSSNNKIYSPVKIESPEKLDAFFLECNQEDFDLQQYITGESYYLLYYIGRNGEITSFSQKNLLQQPNGKSMIAARPSNIHNESICDAYGELLRKIGFYGLVMIELRKSGEKYYMIEANPRMWGPSQLIVDAGVNFFGRLLNDNGAHVKLDEDNPDLSVRYFWSGGGAGDFEKYRISSDEGINDLEEYKKYDIYNRNDTLEIYRYEKGIGES